MTSFIRRAWIPLAVTVAVAGLTVVASQLTVGAGKDQPNPAETTTQGRETAARPAEQRAGGGAGGQRGGPRPPGYGDWWKDEAVRKELNLDDATADRIDVLNQARLRLGRLYLEAWQKERKILDQMASERVATKEEYEFQASRMWSLRMELDKSRAVMVYRIFLELSPEQYRKLEEIRDRRQRGRGGSPR
jgi:hypothetical protein